ncbi:MAG: RluA family pseudouridine synthase [Defluviitaleaceae bacterium]|nr:RluA family pseudouridine synthase [Defluviitaleaceae bacterium]
MVEITLTPNQANRRFDRFLQSYLSQAPGSLVHKLIRKKRIKLNGKRAQGNEITAAGDHVIFYLSPETMQSFMAKASPPPRNWGPVDIVYEDENILLANKPAGLLTHSDTPGSQDTLVDRLAYYLHEKTDFTPSVCNRLDRNTSGLVACGKNMAAVQTLNTIFAERKVDKIYLAVVCGHMKAGKKGDLRGYLYKDEKANRSYIFDEPREDAVAVHTEYECISVGEDFSVVRIRLHTGKSHQIRAHFAALGHPLAGDVKYGSKLMGNKRGQMLHCLSLRFLEVYEGPLAYLSGQEWQAAVPIAFDDLAKPFLQK